MSFDKEFESIVKQESSGGKYISIPGVFVVEITGCKLSDDIEKKDFKGTPYILFTFKTDEDLTSDQKFHRVKDGDSEKAIEYKQSKIKELFANAGVNLAESGAKALIEIAGKKVKALFRTEEYVGYDKDNQNKPIIKEVIKYLYSGPADAKLAGKQSYFQKPLNEKDKAKYDAELKKWNRDNPSDASPEAKAEPTKDDDSKVEANDDLPF